MVRVIFYLIVLTLLAGIGLLGYSFVADMAPPKTQVEVPVTPAGAPEDGS